MSVCISPTISPSSSFVYFFAMAVRNRAVGRARVGYGVGDVSVELKPENLAACHDSKLHMDSYVRHGTGYGLSRLF